MFFHFLSTIKVNIVVKIMQNAYLCVIFHVKHKKTISRSFNLISNSWLNPRWWPRWRPLLVTSQASSSATTHNIYLIFLRTSKAFHLRENPGLFIFCSKTFNRIIFFIIFRASSLLWTTRPDQLILNSSAFCFSGNRKKYTHFFSTTRVAQIAR